MISTLKVIKILVVSSILFSILNCKSDVQNEVAITVEPTTTDTTKISAKDIAKIKYTEYALSDLTQAKTINWQKFIELSIEIERLKTADLSFFRDDKAILVGFITDLKNEVPESLNTTSILVRLTVIETVFLKLEGLASLSTAKKEDLLAAIKDVLISHTNLIFQINKKFEKESQKIEKPK
jgi:hypothetical protein